MIRYLLLLLASCSAMAAWNFDWRVRTDQHGQPAGVYATTPFPITESSTDYTVTFDEGSVTFNLGTKYYVDGAKADDSGDGLSLANAKQTIGAALTAAGTGNKTVIVRGAHDAFDGIYHYTTTLSLGSNTGTSDTARFSLVGYGQERPIIDGSGGSYGDGDAIVNLGSSGLGSASYQTLQRFKLQNATGRGLYTRNSNVRLIDVEIYNVEAGTDSGDGCFVFYSNGHSNQVYHCTAHRAWGHGVKFAQTGSDPAPSHGFIEWTEVYECGWWSGVNYTGFVTKHPCGLDVPNDHESSTNMVIRYNISHDIYMEGIHIRRGKNIQIHHNEVYSCGRGAGVKADYWSSGGENAGIIIYGDTSNGYEDVSGAIYGNIVRDNGETGSDANIVSGLRIGAQDSGTMLVYNNLVYGFDTDATTYPVQLNSTYDGTVNVWNNTVYGSKSGTLLNNTTTATIQNNVIYQAGAGSCFAFAASSTWDHNLYYYPSGTLGNRTADATDVDGSDPLFVSVPSGAWSNGEGMIGAGSPAIGVASDLSGSFSVDANGLSRGAVWDIGAYEYNPTVQKAKSTGKLKLSGKGKL